MPRKGKKRVFKGTPWWAKLQSEPAHSSHSTVSTSSATHTLQPDPTTEKGVTDVCQLSEASETILRSSQQSKNTKTPEKPVDSELTVAETASEKKLKPHIKLQQNPNVNVTSTSAGSGKGTSKAGVVKEPSGYRFIHLESLEAAVNGLHKCETGTLKLREDGKLRRGFSSLLFFECSTCSKRSYLQTSSHSRSSAYTWKASDSADVNKRMTFAACEVGLGRESLNMMADIMNMPQAVSGSLWNDKIQNILHDAKQEVTVKFEEARKRVREKFKEEYPDITEETVIDIPVSFDGTWSKRGFTANYGVGFVISLHTGEVLDFSLKSKYCNQCARVKFPKDSEEYKSWFESHKESCTKNFEGSSGAMERECAKDLWQASMQHKLRYKYMICDGDSKAYNDVWDIYGVCAECEKFEKMDRKSKMYEEWVASEAYVKWKNDHSSGVVNCNRVLKLDCVGHVQKRMGKALRELKKKGGKLDDGKAIGGRGHRLTDGNIDKLQLYYGRAIRSCTTKVTSDPERIQSSLNKMRNAVLAVLYHSVINEDDTVRHQYCPDGDESWCTYKKTGGRIEDKPHHLDPVFLTFLLPVFERLSDPALLRRCLPGFSQNQNESLNSLVWLRAPKHKHRGAKATELAVVLAVLQFNEGTTGKHGLMQRLGMPPGKHSMEGSAKKDSARVKKARQAQEANIKARREMRRQAQKLLDEEFQRREGVSYQSGAFNDLDLLSEASKKDENKRKRVTDQSKSKNAAKKSKLGQK